MATTTTMMATMMLILIIMMMMTTTTTNGKQILRGVATNQWAFGCGDLAALSNVSWYYDYSLKPLANVTNCDCSLGRNVEFVPMVWGAPDVVNITAKLPAGTTHLLAFNEPNFSSQSNISPHTAAVLWLQVEAQLAAAGLLGVIRLGTPSAAPGGDRLSLQVWFQDFFSNCTALGPCHFDFITTHIYDCNWPYLDAGSVNYWVSQVAGYGLPIWITEFDCPTTPAGPAQSVANETVWMNRVLSSLDSNAQIERYAWFTARATNVGTIPSLLQNNGPFLTTVGALYNSVGNYINGTARTCTTSASPSHRASHSRSHSHHSHSHHSHSHSHSHHSHSHRSHSKAHHKHAAATSSSSSSTSIAAGASVGGFFGLILIVAAVVLYRRRPRQQKKNNGNPGTNMNNL